jgi:NADPH:quinone reductase-like Zn-dependent oxidoreductase
MRGIQIKEYLKVNKHQHIQPCTSKNQLTAKKSPDQLVVSDLPDPTPKDDAYLIQVHAAAANFFDILQIQGKYQNQPRK